MEEGPLSLAAVVPLFGLTEVIEQCLISIDEQTDPFDEVVLVDDANGSRSLTLLIERYISDKPNWQVLVMPEPAGIVEATRAGIICSSSSYIAMIDCDDLLTPEAASEVRARLTRTRPMLLGSWYETFTDSGVLSTHRPADLLPVYGAPLSLALEHTFLSHLKVGRRDFLLDQGLRPGTDGVQDWFMGIAAVEADAYEVLPRVLYRHRVHESQTSFTARDQFLKLINDRRAQLIRPNRTVSSTVRKQMAGVARLLRGRSECFFPDSATMVVALGMDARGLFAVPGAISWLELVLHERHPQWLLIIGNQWLDLGALPLEGLRGSTIIGIVADVRWPTSVNMAQWYSGYLDVVVTTSAVTKALIAPSLAQSTRLIGAGG